jgi:serine/threonine protein kinase
LKNDHIKIGDFGIAKNMFDEQSAETIGKGTNIYMSPELILLNYGTDISIEKDDLKKI